MKNLAYLFAVPIFLVPSIANAGAISSGIGGAIGAYAGASAASSGDPAAAAGQARNSSPSNPWVYIDDYHINHYGKLDLLLNTETGRVGHIVQEDDGTFSFRVIQNGTQYHGN